MRIESLEKRAAKILAPQKFLNERESLELR